MNVGGICLTIKKQLSFKASAHKINPRFKRHFDQMAILMYLGYS